MTSVRWNTFEALVYHLALCLHHIALFSVASREVYGCAGILFSYVYLAVALAQAGFAGATLPQTNMLMLSRSYFIREITTYTLSSCIVVSLVMSIIQLTGLFAALPAGGFLIALALVISETIRENFKMVLQIAFSDKSRTAAGIATVISYCSVVWLVYLIKGDLTFYSITLPLVASSIIACGALLISIIKIANTLPHTRSHSPQDETPHSSWTNNALTIIYHLSKLPFSGNFITPILAASVGIGEAAVFKFASDITRNIFSIARKAIIGPASALFGWTHYEQTDKRISHLTTISRMWYIILGTAPLCILAIVAGYYLTHTTTPQYLWSYVITLLILSSSENVIAIHETFCIAEGNSKILTSLGIFALSVAGTVYALLPTNQLHACLIAVTITRVILSLVVYLSRKHVRHYQPARKPHTNQQHQKPAHLYRQPTEKALEQ